MPTLNTIFSKNSMIFLTIVLVAGSNISTIIPTTFAEQYVERKYSEEGYDNNAVKENHYKKGESSSDDEVGVTANNLYQVGGPQQFGDSEGHGAGSIAQYHDGDFVISGGYTLIQDSETLDLEYLQDVPTIDGTGWNVAFIGGTEETWIQAIAICYDTQ